MNKAAKETDISVKRNYKELNRKRKKIEKSVVNK